MWVGAEESESKETIVSVNFQPTTSRPCTSQVPHDRSLEIAPGPLAHPRSSVCSRKNCESSLCIRHCCRHRGQAMETELLKKIPAFMELTF